MTAITPEIVREHGLSPDEYARIKRLLNREPNLVELGIFSAMWSEHCSYKSSRVHLKKLQLSDSKRGCRNSRIRCVSVNTIKRRSGLA